MSPFLRNCARPAADVLDALERATGQQEQEWWAACSWAHAILDAAGSRPWECACSSCLVARAFIAVELAAADMERDYAAQTRDTDRAPAPEGSS